jgi:hypothetical protein
MLYWQNTCTKTTVELIGQSAALMPSLKKDGQPPIEDAEVKEYLVLQRSGIKKLGSDPTGTAMVNVKRQVGSTVFTTGRVWTGRGGAKWVELDKIVEKPGWLLVEGRGFGPPGPLLCALKPGDPAPMVLKVLVPTPSETDEKTSQDYRKFVVNQNATVRDTKEWIALIFGFDPSHVIIGERGIEMQPLSADPMAKVLKDDKMGIGEAGFKDGDKVPYYYTGDPKKAFEGKVPTWEGKLGVKRKLGPSTVPSQPPEDQRKKAPVKPQERSELTEHFKILGLEEGVEPDGIKRQYRLLALACHPDKHPDDVEGATAKFQALKAAYEAIRDALDL